VGGKDHPLAGVITRCLNLNPKGRPTMRELAYDLSALCNHPSLLHDPAPSSTGGIAATVMCDAESSTMEDDVDLQLSQFARLAISHSMAHTFDDRNVKVLPTYHYLQGATQVTFEALSPIKLDDMRVCDLLSLSKGYNLWLPSHRYKKEDLCGLLAAYLRESGASEVHDGETFYRLSPPIPLEALQKALLQAEFKARTGQSTPDREAKDAVLGRLKLAVTSPTHGSLPSIASAATLVVPDGVARHLSYAPTPSTPEQQRVKLPRSAKKS
jgi:hypothetical protein